MSSILSAFPSVRGINSDIRNMIIASMLTNFADGFAWVALPVYLYGAGMGSSIVGLVVTAISFIGAILAVPIAMLSDSWGRKRFVVIGFFLVGIGGLLFFLSLDMTLIFLAATMLGLASASISSPLTGLFADKCTDEGNRNNMFVLLGFSGGIAAALGALVSGAPSAIFSKYFGLGAVDSYRPLFLIQFLLGVTAGLVVLFGVRESAEGLVMKHREAHRRGLALKSPFKAPRKSISVLLRFSVLGLMGLGAGMIIPLLPLWFHLKFALDISVLGPLFSVMMFLTSFASLFTPAMAEKQGNVRTIVFTQLSSVILLVSIPFTPMYIGTGALIIARDALANMAGPIMNSFIAGIIPSEERATAFSIIGMLQSVPRAFGPALAGYLFSLSLLDLPFFVTASLYTASIVGFYVLFRNVKPTDSKEAIASSIYFR